MARFACPCCGYLTLPRPERGSYDLCEVCWWEDDQIQFRDPDYEGGANGPSLRQARINFQGFGSSDGEGGVGRAPKLEELPRQRLEPL